MKSRPFRILAAQGVAVRCDRLPRTVRYMAVRYLDRATVVMNNKLSGRQISSALRQAVMDATELTQARPVIVRQLGA